MDGEECNSRQDVLGLMNLAEIQWHSTVRSHGESRQETSQQGVLFARLLRYKGTRLQHGCEAFRQRYHWSHAGGQFSLVTRRQSLI